ncbi:NETI motif-containing protein [Staphylococcus saccharolyticus]|uniref:NETI motif-containing protein n=1 Tax=Staphylococcus saccharolyticus TaxID=33028 RepID=A0A380H288_9STAP|nr:NETI motif-containing protein [Staphylococcus saccharolyticus]MBL7565954.1 NETI motif-containing protein [Staphylococcus saccharolyticus]MBL7572393.1 NETI motif-containing protein [Staphylococcus saccharolyticus]QQB98531.1 NETI motif-containing protein [Staphylococcus saccharolyticus]QRJ67253.1 NETI motif-containing protein [Staphylococcus saccharolyticus]RTX92761.1 NETI motif-containing protein [Staphylococcus saccharolyticus]
MSKKFKVKDNETVADCLARMRNKGYMPTHRMEKPVYKENKDGSIEVFKQDIIFVGKSIEQ